MNWLRNYWTYLDVTGLNFLHQAEWRLREEYFLLKYVWAFDQENPCLLYLVFLY